MYDVLNKIRRRWMKLRLQPIRVLCFHQTSETYDPEVYCKPDWIPLNFLKNYVEQLQAEGYEFISLQEAYEHIKNDRVRGKKYAVLTADDGFKCNLNLVPWLEERQIPITLFVNLETLDGKTCGCVVKKYFEIKDQKTELKHAKELYFTRDDMQLLSPLVSIGMHGVNHEEVAQLSAEKFKEVVTTCVEALAELPNYIPFYAYTYGKHSQRTQSILHQEHIVPVYADGKLNYNCTTEIHREPLEYIYKCQSQLS